MFSPHGLLDRKKPLGQIWRAAILHAEINRKNLHELDIIEICDQILSPSFPKDLRLSGILKGGVAIVYERKVKKLHDDANRVLVEICKAMPAQDRTLPAKNREI